GRRSPSSGEIHGRPGRCYPLPGRYAGARRHGAHVARFPSEDHPVITSWLAKVVVGVGLLVFLLIEISSPIITRAQLGDTASKAADAAVSELKVGHDATAARHAADTTAQKDDAGVDEFSVSGDVVRLRVSREAHSYLL